MLDQGIKDALQEYAKKVSRNVVFKLNPGEHEKRAELVDMLETVAGMSDLITLEHGEVSQSLASGVTFEVLSAGNAEGVIFSGVPGGHEFSSFVLAFLQVGGVALKLDESVQKLVAAMNQPLKFQTVISLSCHNCPDVVQTLNQFAMLNPNITHEMIDGGLYPEFVEKHKVQGVPSVILNDEPFANGKVEPASLIAKLQEYTTKNAPADAEPVTTQITLEDLLANLQDVLVVGGGPAGVSSAIYAARKGLKVTLVAERFGGQVKDTVGIENLISVPHTTGTELTAHLRQHVESYSVAIKEHFKVTRVAKLQDEFSDVPADIKSDIHLVYLSSGEVIASKTMIIATGAKWRELGVPGEKENIGSGVAYCPHCD
ncbi:MAG TPA: alkyl hydroperoxide reductase subunit F, partial [Gammaproteobacteria bacterium]|nr:alkyl hydroperoxide reductase subunit F [Gammaproteobacteria bacterium]